MTKKQIATIIITMITCVILIILRYIHIYIMHRLSLGYVGCGLLRTRLVGRKVIGGQIVIR
jgi:hypothetical protein